MRNKETGEFELVVGDKQLLSAFFIGVLLLAVVFAMGYVLGQNSPKSTKAPTETAATPSNNAVDSHPQSPSASTPAPETTPAPAAQPPDAAATDASTAAPAEPPPQPTTVPAREPDAKPAPPKRATPAAADTDEQPAGSYWQVLAGSTTSADAMQQSLKGHGFPVITRPGPNNLTLVWVGPYPDKEALSRAKKQLEEAGITNLYKKP